jgi:RNA polymerase sigma-70 factor (ECF subfamily)
MTNDSALLKRARTFDEDALAEIYATFSPMIYGYALRLSGEPDTAEECVAETFSRFLIALHNGQGPNDYLKAYLYRVAHNWITDLYRRARPETVLDPELRASYGDEPHVAVGQLLEQQSLRAALAELTTEQQQVIALKYLEEMDNAEIAAILQKPVGAVKSLQHRGLAALRRLLTPEVRETDHAPRNSRLEAGGRGTGHFQGEENEGILPADGFPSRPDASV